MRTKKRRAFLQLVLKSPYLAPIGLEFRKQDAVADDANQQRIQGYCGLCVARCGTVAIVEDGGFT